jgi:hypothetical protein
MTSMLFSLTMALPATIRTGYRRNRKLQALKVHYLSQAGAVGQGLALAPDTPMWVSRGRYIYCLCRDPGQRGYSVRCLILPGSRHFPLIPEAVERYPSMKGQW